MDALKLLRRAYESGLSVSADGACLVVQGPKRAAPLAQAVLKHKDEIIPLVPSTWNEDFADVSIAITLQRVGQLHDEFAPECSLETPDWDRAEALVSEAYALRNRQALRSALDAFEQYAVRSMGGAIPVVNDVV